VTSEIIGIGTDLVDLDRFRTVLDRTPRIVARLFTEGEQAYACGRRDPTEPLGARFAAKEAAMKALGVGLGEVDFRDVEVARLDSGAPVLRVHGRAAERARALGVTRWLVTLSHTAHLAQAVVVALADGEAGDRLAGVSDEEVSEMTQRVIRRAINDPQVAKSLGLGRRDP
jgi:holo-[acyl-carrier protein] synthase